MLVLGVIIAHEAGLETTSVVKYEFAEQDKLFDDIRYNTYGKEGNYLFISENFVCLITLFNAGSVLYYVDAGGNVIGMMKKKTVSSLSPPSCTSL